MAKFAYQLTQQGINHLADVVTKSHITKAGKTINLAKLSEYDDDELDHFLDAKGKNPYFVRKEVAAKANGGGSPTPSGKK